MTVTTTRTTPDSGAQPGVDPAAAAPYQLSPEHRRVFIGLMLGMLVASISQTIVGPALPRIVAELGGMEHYSWLATAAMLVSAISVPIVGKLSDLYGRRPFYLGGIIVFMAGSVLAGISTNFWMLVAARAVQGLGMGTLMPLSQTIIGDIIPPRQRGKYQGLMGAVFGVTSVAGPLAGGFITDQWGWRWLFFVSLPIGIVAFFAIARFLHLEHTPRKAQIDTWGILTLSVSLVLLLLATSFGGSTYAWDSNEIKAMYLIGGVMLLAFLLIEGRVEEPVIPLRLFRSSLFSFSVIASFVISMMMFGAIIYIPVYAQGVLGVNATNSGLILMPLMLGLVTLSMVSGLFITRTGNYKAFAVGGSLIMGVGYWLLTRLDYDATQLELTLAMVVLGVGLGACMQVYTLVVQNAAHREDLGVATAAIQFFRNVGSTVGIAVFGTIMTSRMHDAIVSHLPAGAAARMQGSDSGVGSVLDPAQLAKLPAAMATAVRQGLSDTLHDVFLVGLPLSVLAVLATLMIRSIPLRDTVHNVADQGRELMDTLGQSSGSGVVLPLRRERGQTRTSERLLGIEFDQLCAEGRRPARPLLRRAIADLGGDDYERGLALLSRTSVMLTTEDGDIAAKSEKYAVEVADRGRRHGGALSNDLRLQLATSATTLDSATVLAAEEPPVTTRYEALDLDLLRSVGHDLTAAFMVDLHQSRQVSQRA